LRCNGLILQALFSCILNKMSHASVTYFVAMTKHIARIYCFGGEFLTFFTAASAPAEACPVIHIGVEHHQQK
jgi:hypothetical protein